MKGKCQAVLKSGKKCKNVPKQDGYCDLHFKKITAPADKTPVDEAPADKAPLIKQVVKAVGTTKAVEASASTPPAGKAPVGTAKADKAPADTPPTIDARVLKLIEINKSVPDQRTQEWSDLRYNAITASDCAKVLLLTQYEMKLYEDKVIYIATKNPKLGSCCYTGSNIKEVFRKKVLPPEPYKKMYAAALVHGTRYENVCSTIYEHRTQRKVLDFGLIPHPTIPFIAASPDGVTECGRMIEIKAPKSRKINGIPLIYYWMQMQQQLQCCGLDICDFVECEIGVYINEQEYLEDIWENAPAPDRNNANNVNVNVYPKNHEGLEKGCAIFVEFLDGDDSDQHYCSPLNLESHDEMINWINHKIVEIVAQQNAKYARNLCLDGGNMNIIIQWWYLKVYSEVEVKRDDVWWQRRFPDFERFWKSVQRYRVEGLPESCLAKPKKAQSTITFGATGATTDSGVDATTDTQLQQMRKTKSKYAIVLDDDDE